MRGSMWIRSPGWDLLTFQSFFWVFPLAFLVYFVVGEKAFFLFAASFFLLFRVAHLYFAAYLCLGHPNYKHISRRRWKKYYLAPLIFLILVICFFMLPEHFIGLSPKQKLQVYIFLEFPYAYAHYALQHYGILSIYRSRQGQKLSRREARVEKLYCHTTTTLLISLLTLKNFYDVGLMGFSYGEFLGVEYVDWNFWAVLIVAAFVAYMTFFELRRERQITPKLLYIWSMAIMTSVVSLGGVLIAWMLLDMHHFISVFGLAPHIQANTHQEKKRASFFYAALGFIGFSICLTVIYYYFGAYGVDQKRYALLLGDYIPVRESGMITTFFFGLFIAVGVLHYWYDRLAFRFSDPEVRNVARELI